MGTPESSRERAREVLVSLVLVAVALTVYRRVGGFAFVLDDQGFILDNPRLGGTLGPSALWWALGTFHTGNWHPLTWLSHLIDVRLFGLNAGRHHLVSLCIHALNGALLFLVLRRATGRLWPSAFTAAFFAVHPLHVESVAWVAERKDLLSGLFWVLAVGAYLRYTARPGPARYACVAGLFVLGLMTKPMVITLPLVLLLLDWWPLGRLPRPGVGAGPWQRLLLEKVPLLLLSAAIGVVTLVAQRSMGAVVSLEDQRLSWRVMNALVSLTLYLRDTLWPSRLAVLYPHPLGNQSVGAAVGAAALLAAVTAAVILARRRAPFLLTGWLWYLVMLLPVLGVVQVGGQARADRYMYLPLVGLGLMAGWGVPALALRARSARRWIAPVAGAALAALGVAASAQAEHWRTPVALFRRALAVTTDNWLANNCYAVELEKQGRAVEALAYHREAVRLNPASPELNANLAAALSGQGRYEEAATHFRAALLLDPGNAVLAEHLGQTLGRLGRFPEALEAFRRAVRLQGNLADAWNGLGGAYGSLGRPGEAEAAFREALRLRPDHPEARDNLERLLSLR